MKQIIIYDLKNKDNLERTRILQKLYGHKNKSNYDYSYKRKGLLEKIKHKRERKTVLYFNNGECLEKASRILKELGIKFEIAVS
ncbi:MAG TPA: hypothetical protein VJ438_04770 [Candidatus Nanoarchaeia archaeon]|nr:hypothetical protein [Candidatus Nanoarchaeia archaeon]